MIHLLQIDRSTHMKYWNRAKALYWGLVGTILPLILSGL